MQSLKMKLVYIFLVLVKFSEPSAPDEGEAIFSEQVDRHKLMTGGKHANFGQFPYQVGIMIKGMYVCGGSIIHGRFVLTAAHCFFNDDCTFRNSDVRVTAGTNDLNPSSATNVTVQVEKLYVPRMFFEKHWYLRGDIAVLRLEESLSYHTEVPTSILYRPRQESYEYERAIFTGYGWNWVKTYRDSRTGKLKRYGGTNLKLRFAETLVYENEECEELWDRQIPDSLICARVLQQDPSKPEGICAGDSGGPLVIRGVLVGIASLSPKECKEHILPAIFTRVSSHLKFIDKALKDAADKETYSIRFLH